MIRSGLEKERFELQKDDVLTKTVWAAMPGKVRYSCRPSWEGQNGKLGVGSFFLWFVKALSILSKGFVDDLTNINALFFNMFQ